jgi:transcriptional regulator with PAS, ATPase and Fis domain
MRSVQVGLSADLSTGEGDVYRRAMKTLFERLADHCEGAVVVDDHARIVWISDKYLRRLHIASAAEALGREVEAVIPNSLMREVVRTGEPILLDIMEIGDESLVVTRMPLNDADGRLIGAIGFVLYDRLQSIRPLISKFARLQADLERTQRKLAEERRAKYTLSSFVGASPVLLELKRRARRAAQLDTTVLLLGETGTGKELLAHAIHATSPRAQRPFVAVNVAAIPETLLEAEFFGAVPGAYTGVDKRGREGKFALADGGTLFLDEVGDMPLPLQAKLLRVLQEQEIEPLGSNRVMHLDVRVIAATSLDLNELVRVGRFRPDLFYRLNVLSIRLPPLREHVADLGAIGEVILEQIAQRTGMRQCELSISAIDFLGRWHWPGNIRELRNVLEKAVLECDHERLEAGDFRAILPRVEAAPAEREPSPARAAPVVRLAEAVAAAEREAIAAALAASGGRKSVAAQLLGISRATLYEKLGPLTGASAGAGVSGSSDTSPARRGPLRH